MIYSYGNSYSDDTLVHYDVFQHNSLSPFQRELMILQNAINNWYTFRDNFSDLHAETLSQTGVSCSYVLYVIIAKYVPCQRHFYDNKIRLIFYSMLNSGDTKSCYCRK